MIDPLTEDLLDLKQAIRLPPFLREGRPPSLCQIYRYVQRGVRGVRLEVIHTPGGMKTSREAVERFIRDLTRKALGAADAAGAEAAAVSSGHEAAGRRLAAVGI